MRSYGKKITTKLNTEDLESCNKLVLHFSMKFPSCALHYHVAAEG